MPQQQQFGSMFFLPYILIFVIFYFLYFRPQGKQEKERQRMLANLKKNDEIVTSSGIHGIIVNVKDKSVILRIDENVKIELDKNCVAYVLKQEKGSQE